jgi:hypothetical protein
MNGLVLHAGGWNASTDEIAAVPLPEATRSYHPVAHLDYMNAVKDQSAAGERAVAGLAADFQILLRSADHRGCDVAECDRSRGGGDGVGQLTTARRGPEGAPLWQPENPMEKNRELWVEAWHEASSDMYRWSLMREGPPKFAPDVLDEGEAPTMISALAVGHAALRDELRTTVSE